MMSYRYTALGHIHRPTGRPARYYVYVLEDPDTEEHRLTYAEFCQIGRRLGGDVLLVGSEDIRLCTEVIHEYSVKWRGDPLMRRQQAFPILLVTTVHPSEIIDAVAGTRSPPDYGLLPLGPYTPHRREELVGFLVEEFAKDRADMRTLEKDAFHEALWTVWKRIMRRAKLQLHIGPLTTQFPTREEVERHGRDGGA